MPGVRDPIEARFKRGLIAYRLAKRHSRVSSLCLRINKKERVMNAKQFKKLLEDLNACSDARNFAAKKTLRQAWKECRRADWMLWLLKKMAGKTGWPKFKTAGSLICDCAETAMPIYAKYYPKDKRPQMAIDTARKYYIGKTTLEELNAAVRAAVGAARAAAWAAGAAAGDAAWATWAAAWAAGAAAWATGAAAWAAGDAWAAAWAAGDAAWATWAAAWATGAAAHELMCDMIRKKIPYPIKK
jgi:hypothetical protein